MPFKTINMLLTVFRYLLTVLGAAALLYAFSYPNSIILPSAEWDFVDDLSLNHILKGLQAMAAVLFAPVHMLFPQVPVPVAEGLTPECFSPWLWVGPWLFMEIVSGLGDRRNLVWFGALGTVLLISLIAWPVLQANHPEFISPTVSFDDGKLSEGMIKFGIFLFFSFLFRKVILDFLFKEKAAFDDNDLNYADADVLDPANARTVREIAADPAKVQPKFLYGDADEGLISRFRLLMVRLFRRRLYTACAIVAGVLLLAAWIAFYPQPTEEEALQRDIENLFAQSPLRNAKGDVYATPQAVNAAYRVFSQLADVEKDSIIGQDDSVLEKRLQLDKVDPAYLRQARSGRIVPDPVSVYMPDKEDRYLTLSDGTRAATLIVRHIDGRISSVEIQYSGWNPRADYTSWLKWRKIRSSFKKD